MNNSIITINHRVLDISTKTGKLLDFLNINCQRIPKFWTTVTERTNAECKWLGFLKLLFSHCTCTYFMCITKKMLSQKYCQAKKGQQ